MKQKKQKKAKNKISFKERVLKLINEEIFITSSCLLIKHMRDEFDLDIPNEKDYLIKFMKEVNSKQNDLKESEVN